MITKLSEHFTLSEMTKSQTASRRGINNEPDSMARVNLTWLCVKVLEPVRRQFGVTVVNSGYRSPELNQAIGGSLASQHCLGNAADIECPGHSNVAVAEFIRDFLKFDQLILECYEPHDPSSGWVHVSWAPALCSRSEVLTFSDGCYVRGLPK